MKVLAETIDLGEVVRGPVGLLVDCLNHYLTSLPFPNLELLLNSRWQSDLSERQLWLQVLLQHTIYQFLNDYYTPLVLYDLDTAIRTNRTTVPT